MDAPKISSRWSREPSLDKRRARTKQGNPRKRILSKRDIKILKLLNEFRYLPADDIHAYVGGSYEGVRRALNALYRDAYLNRPHQQRENANANYAKLIYELDTAGRTVLKDLGITVKPKVYHTNFVHELMVSRIMASLRLGMGASADATFISWAVILAADHTPRKLKDADKPTHIPCRIRHRKGVEESFIAADYQPFGLNIQGKYSFFPGIEADCGTEPLSPADYDRSSIQRKFAAYLDIIASKTYGTHFGFPILFVPFFFPTVSRMESAMALLERMTTDKQSLRRYFLFKTFPTLTSYGKQAPPTGHVFMEPFARVQYAPFSLKDAK